MNSTAYADYLESDHWQLLKLKKSKLTMRCFICRKIPDKRNFHHVRYKRWTDVTTSDIRLCCEPCHHAYHALKRAHPQWSEEQIVSEVVRFIAATEERARPKAKKQRITPPMPRWKRLQQGKTHQGNFEVSSGRLIYDPK